MTETKINLNNLDKSNWQSYRFDEIAQSISERIDPTNTDLEVYVGLEHIDSESIHLKRHGHKSDVKGQKLRFYQGDVIFGRRRAYQRKAAVAEMDGFCSAHALVLRANPDVILPELFPFFLHSDQFMNRAVDISVGSLSPTINWGSLRKETFVIPPKEQQLKLAELFLSVDKLIQKNSSSCESFLVLEKTKTKHIFLSNSSDGYKTPIGFVNREWKCLTLQELIDDAAVVSHLDGNHGSNYPKASEFVSEGIPYISANCIEDGEIIMQKAKFLTEARSSVIKKGVALDGDVLLAHNATVGPVGILNTNLPKIILSTTLTYYRVDPKRIDNQFLFYYMQSRLFQGQLERVMNQSTRNQVPITTQRKLYFVVLLFSVQQTQKSFSMIAGEIPLMFAVSANSSLRSMSLSWAVLSTVNLHISCE